MYDRRMLVLIAAFLGWMFDGLEMGIFPQIARSALGNLLAGGASEDVIKWWHQIIDACFLFGPIDVAPGDASNSVDLGGTSVVVALLSTSSFSAANVQASSARFGRTGTEAAPTASAKVDVNGDGRNDLRLTFAVSQTGLDCTSSAAELSATDPASKKTFYERDTVTPVPC